MSDEFEQWLEGWVFTEKERQYVHEKNVGKIEQSLEKQDAAKERRKSGLPEWLPEPIKEKIDRTWIFLSEKYTYQQIIDCIKSYASDEPRVPNEIMEAIGALAEVHYAVTLGEKDGLELLAGPDARRGRKVHQGSKDGHAAVHGTSEEKQERWGQYQADLKQAHKEHPLWKITALRKSVAKKHGVSLTTIRNNTHASW